MSDAFEEMADQLRREKAHEAIRQAREGLGFYVQQIRNRPADDDAWALENVLSTVAMTLLEGLAPVHLATLTAVALAELAGVDTSVPEDSR